MNKKLLEKSSFSAWEVALKCAGWGVAEWDSEKDNERQYHFSNFKKEM